VRPNVTTTRRIPPLIGSVEDSTSANGRYSGDCVINLIVPGVRTRIDIRRVHGIMSYERRALCDWVLTRCSVKVIGSRIFAAAAHNRVQRRGIALFNPKLLDPVA
jgi:hypothetical protein